MITGWSSAVPAEPHCCDLEKSSRLGKSTREAVPLYQTNATELTRNRLSLAKFKESRMLLGLRLPAAASVHPAM